MFKIGKLEKVENEEVTITLVKQEHKKYEKGIKVSEENFKTLSFNISGNDYSLSFDLNCRLEKLLELPLGETIDFNDYIFEGETWLNTKEESNLEPLMDIKITRYIKNKYIILLTFYTDYMHENNNIYSGMIEFTFNLDDYLTKEKN